MGRIIPHIMEHKNVPNHQPDVVRYHINRHLLAPNSMRWGAFCIFGVVKEHGGTPQSPVVEFLLFFSIPL